MFTVLSQLCKKKLWKKKQSKIDETLVIVFVNFELNVKVHRVELYYRKIYIQDDVRLISPLHTKNQISITIESNNLLWIWDQTKLTVIY